VVHGLLLLISPVRYSTGGGPETTAGFYCYCCKQFQFQLWLGKIEQGGSQVLPERGSRCKTSLMSMALEPPTCRTTTT
jgi:hypothetical protein